MNSKGQLGGGILLTLAVAVIVGLVLLQAVATNVEQGTRSVTGVITARNTTVVGTAGTTYELTGQELVSVLQVTNKSGGENVESTNYTIAECVRTSDNLKGICYYAKAGDWAGKGINVSYTYYPVGYMDDSGSRAIFGLVLLLGALAIAIVVIVAVKNAGGGLFE